MSSKDLKSNGIRGSRLIMSGGISGGGLNSDNSLGLAVYSASHASNESGGLKDSNMLSDVGSDTALFVSGNASFSNATFGPDFGTIDLSSEARVLLGGDLVVSGVIMGGNPWMAGAGPTYTNTGDLAIIAENLVGSANVYEFASKGQAPGSPRRQGMGSTGFGYDTYMYITGTVGTRGTDVRFLPNDLGIVCMAGDLHVSGNLSVGGTGGGGGGGTLDQAYDSGGTGAGAKILADGQAVQIDGAGRPSIDRSDPVLALTGTLSFLEQNSPSSSDNAKQFLDLDNNLILINSSSNADIRIFVKDNAEVKQALILDGDEARVGVFVPEGEEPETTLHVSASSDGDDSVILIEGGWDTSESTSAALQIRANRWNGASSGPASSRDAAYAAIEVVSGSINSIYREFRNDNSVVDGNTTSAAIFSVSQTVFSKPNTVFQDFQLAYPAYQHITNGYYKAWMTATSASNGPMVLMMSGSSTGASALDPREFEDTNFFVSGTINSKDTSIRGTSVFGGDLHISGNLTVDGSSPGGGGGGGTLDQAYDFGGSGLGREITADNGAVAINAATNPGDMGLVITGSSTSTFLTLAHSSDPDGELATFDVDNRGRLLVETLGGTGNAEIVLLPGAPGIGIGDESTATGANKIPKIYFTRAVRSAIVDGTSIEGEDDHNLRRTSGTANSVLKQNWMELKSNRGINLQQANGAPVVVNYDEADDVDFRVGLRSSVGPISKTGALILDGGTVQAAILTDGLTAADAYVDNVSATGRALPDDVALFISGAIGGKGTTTGVAKRGTSVFAGDLHVSGNLTVDGSSPGGGGGGNTLDQAYDQGGSGVGAIITVDSQPVQLQTPSAYVYPGLALTGTLEILANSKVTKTTAAINDASDSFSTNRLGSGLGVLLVSGSKGNIVSPAKRKGLSAFAGDLLVSGNIINAIAPTSTNDAPGNNNLDIATAGTKFGDYGNAMATYVRDYANLSLVVTGTTGQTVAGALNLVASNLHFGAGKQDVIGFNISTAKFKYSDNATQDFDFLPNSTNGSISPAGAVHAATILGTNTYLHGSRWDSPGAPFSFGHVGIYSPRQTPGNQETKDLQASYTYLPSGSASTRFRLQASISPNTVYSVSGDAAKFSAIDVASAESSNNASYLLSNTPDGFLNSSGQYIYSELYQNDVGFCSVRTPGEHRSAVGIGTSTPNPSSLSSTGWDTRLQIAGYTKFPRVDITLAKPTGLTNDQIIGSLRYTVTGSGAAGDLYKTNPDLMKTAAEIRCTLDGSTVNVSPDLEPSGMIQFVTYSSGSSDVIAEVRAPTPKTSEFAVQCLSVGKKGSIAEPDKTNVFQNFVSRASLGVAGVSPGYPGSFQNDLNSASMSRGLLIQCGDYTPSSSGDSKWIELVTGDGTSRAYIQYDTGSPFAAFASVSDARLKKNIEDTKLDTRNIVKSLKWRQFDWKDESFASRQLIGLVAQEVEEVYPRLVSHSGDENDYRNISYSPLLPVAMKELQSLILENEEIKLKNQELETRIDDLEALLKSKGVI